MAIQFQQPMIQKDAIYVARRSYKDKIKKGDKLLVLSILTSQPEGVTVMVQNLDDLSSTTPTHFIELPTMIDVLNFFE